jgi:hypothetical protein
MISLKLQSSIRCLTHSLPSVMLMQLHLTNLTNLKKLNFDVDGTNSSISGACRMPSSLQVLDIVAPAVSGALLTSLTQLHSLTIYQDVLPLPSVLQDIARNCKQLTHVDLGSKRLPIYPSPSELAEVMFRFQEVYDMGDALAALPLRGLCLRQSGLKFLVPQIHQLTQLTGLTLLNLRADGMIQGFKMMAKQLQPLTALQQLELAGELAEEMYHGLPAMFFDLPVTPHSYFVQTIAGLPELQQLKLSGMQLGDAALELTAATKLTKFRLSECGCSSDVKKALRAQCASVQMFTAG